MTQALAGPPSQRKKIRVVRREESPARDARYGNGFVGAGQYAPVIRHRGDPHDPHGAPDTEQTSPEFSDFERTHTRTPLSEDAAAALLRAVDGAEEDDGPQVDPRVEATEELSADQILEVEQAVIPPEPTTMRSIHAGHTGPVDESIPEPPPTKPILPVALESSPSAPIISAGPQYSAVSADSSPTLERKSPSTQQPPSSHRRPRSDFSADDSAELQQEAITSPSVSPVGAQSFPTSTPPPPPASAAPSAVASAVVSTARMPPPVPTSRATIVSPALPSVRKPSVVPPSSSQASQVSSVPLDLMFDTLGKAALKTSTLPPPPPMMTAMTRLIRPAPNQFPAQPSMLSVGAPSSSPPSTLRYPALARQSEVPPTTQPMLPMSGAVSSPTSAPIPLVSQAPVESPQSVAIMLTNERRANPTTDHAFAMITETPQIPAPARVPVFPPAQAPHATQAPRARVQSYGSMELLPSYDPQLDTYAPRANKRGVSKWLIASSAALVASALFCAGAFIVYAGQAPASAHALEPMRASHQIQSSNVNGMRIMQNAQTTQASRAPSQVTSAPTTSFASALDLAGSKSANTASGLTNTPQNTVASGIPTLAVDSLPKVINKYGLLHVSPKYEGHRVFVDGAVISSGIGSGGGDFEVYCGRHSIKVGSQSKGRIVSIPCGGETSL